MERPPGYAGRTAALQVLLRISTISAHFRSKKPRLGQFAVKPVLVGLVVAAQSVVDQQSHHVALPGALLERAGLCLLAGLGAGWARDDLFAGRAAVLAAAREGWQKLGVGAELRALERPLLLRLEGETVVVADRAVWAAQRRLGAGLLGPDLPQDHQAQDDQPALGLALLRWWKVHADFGGVHNPSAALLRPDGHVGAHGGGLSRNPLEGEDLGLRAAGRHPGEGEPLPLESQSRAVWPWVHFPWDLLGFLSWGSLKVKYAYHSGELTIYMFLAQVVLLETPIQEATPCGLAQLTLLLK